MINLPEEIKELYMRDSVRKNIRIHFPNGERADITNSNIDGENFSFTESICSRSQLKFGLCEASVVRFTCVGIENIKGYIIEVYHEIDISSLSNEFIAEYGTITEDVAYPYFRWSYGTFVVDKCPRQSDMRRRKVVAYSKEAEWDSIPSAMERAKTNGQIDLKYDSPYHFNVAAVVCSNAYEGAGTHGEEVSLCTVLTHSGFAGNILYGTTQESGVSYSGHVYLESVYVPITSNAEADKLYRLTYDSAENIEKFKTAYVELINDIAYGWNGEYAYLDLDGLVKAVKHGFYQYYKYDYESGVAAREMLALDNHRYVYPFMNYTDTEAELYDESHADYQTVIAIPYAARLEVKYGTTTICSETFSIRDLGSTRIHTVSNLPKIYLSVERKKCSEQSNYGYRVMQSDIPIRNIVQAYAELQGMFGKRNRNGGFEFANVSDNFAVYPGDDTYPGADTYPGGGAGNLSQSNYSSIWYDDDYTKPYESVDVTFTNESGEKVSMTYELVDKMVSGYNADDYQIYDLSDNYLIQHGKVSESEMQIILSTVAANINGLQYMPANIKLSGTPWIEAGDAVTVLTHDDGIETLVLSRTLKGVQSLKDNFVSN